MFLLQHRSVRPAAQVLLSVCEHALQSLALALWAGQRVRSA
jgi:hypothetical protein